MSKFIMGRYAAAIVTSDDAIEQTKLLRGLSFGLSGKDEDAFDRDCIHVGIRHLKDDRLVACFRMQPLDGNTISSSYAAQFYNLDAFKKYEGAMVELGRFCIHPQEHDPDILRVAWAALTVYVDENDVKLLFGCSSFGGIEAAHYTDAFAMLRDRHLAPKQWLPGVKAPNVFKFGQTLEHKIDAKKAMRRMPTLLRTYLLMGGWVSDHAVLDHDLNTMHVFTGVEIEAIPEARKRLLRAIVR